MYQFEIFSAPVRSAESWLGPLVRGDSVAVDAGKVWHTDAPEVSLYRAYRPLCRLWLWFDGLLVHDKAACPSEERDTI